MSSQIQGLFNTVRTLCLQLLVSETNVSLRLVLWKTSKLGLPKIFSNSLLIHEAKTKENHKCDRFWKCGPWNT